MTVLVLFNIITIAVIKSYGYIGTNLKFNLALISSIIVTECVVAVAVWIACV